MSEDAALSNLVNLPVLHELPDEARVRVAKVFYSIAEDRTYQDGEILIHEGYLSFDTGFVLYEGSVLIERTEKENVVLPAPALLGEMSQFSAGDTRSATVRAKGIAKAVDFSWEDLYARAEQELPVAEYDAFRKFIEELVWTRFPYRNIADLPLFSKLDDKLRNRICSPLPGLTEMVRLQTGETLFRAETLCNSTGYLLIKGKVKLIRTGKGEKDLEAPDLIGIFPAKSEDPLKWTATCVAAGSSELLKFSWEQYIKLLGRRISREERMMFGESIKANAARHFRF